MGMFDKPHYLTGGDNAFASVGDTFWLHAAKVEGTVKINGKDLPQAKLKVSSDRDGDPVIVYSVGAGIVGQVSRIDSGDTFPMRVRLDTIPSKQGSGTNVLTPADQPVPTGAAQEDIPF